MSDNLDDIPLPEECTLNDELVSTRKDLVEESDGNLFNRQCDNLDNTIPKRKDRFIECEELPEVPKALLKNKQFNEVEFPGVPLAEIPKKLLAHLLPCCLEGRSAGFDFEIVQELNGLSKAQMSNVASATTKVSIQLGTYSYFIIGLDIKPDLCFCDEDCGDEDYIHIKVNLDAEYHDQDGDNILENPDITINDEQLTNLIANYGGGGGGNPLCAQKLFAIYTGSVFVPYNLASPTVNDYIHAFVAPYLTDLQLVPNGIYKLEYFCEYNSWYVTDGQCSNITPSYSYPSYRLTEVYGLPNQTYRGTFFLDDGEESNYPYDQFSITLDTEASGNTTPEDVFNNGITWTALQDNAERLHYSFSLKEGASGTLVYTALISDSVGSCEQRAFKLIFKLQDTTPAEEELEEEEE